MPTIELKEYKSYAYKKARKQVKTFSYKHLYNTRRWRELRLNYLMQNPICERCKFNLATEVHHIIPLSNANGNVERLHRLGYDPNNLMAVCTQCHHEIHNELNDNDNDSDRN